MTEQIARPGTDVYICTSCNAEVTEGARFCPHCGDPFEPECDTRESCPHCSTLVKADARVCPKCQALLFRDKGDDDVSVDERLTKIENYSLGQMLFREREYLFENIYREKNLDAIIKYFAFWALVFSAIHGFCLGIYSGVPQMLAGAIKVPLLLLLTLAVCSPALYAFNIMLGPRISFRQIISVLCIKTYLFSVILVSFSPIVGFFMVTGGTHDFATLLNVAVFALAGVLGVSLLWKAMQYLTRRNGRQPQSYLMWCWMLVYIFVGTQLAWTLRPFVGAKGDFQLFRQIGGNIYLYVIETAFRMLHIVQ